MAILPRAGRGKIKTVKGSRQPQGNEPFQRRGQGIFNAPKRDEKEKRETGRTRRKPNQTGSDQARPRGKTITPCFLLTTLQRARKPTITRRRGMAATTGTFSVYTMYHGPVELRGRRCLDKQKHRYYVIDTTGFAGLDLPAAPATRSWRLGEGRL